jgi:DNA end-binding protein Ku
VSTAATPQFHQLHAGCGQRIRHEKRCPCHGPVDASAIVRGYPYAPDQHVVVEPEVLERFRPARDKALMIEQFVAATAIDPIFFAGRSLNLLPDGPAAQHLYGVLVAALQRSAQAALGRVVLSGHRQLVLVRARGSLLVTDVLHYPAQVRATSAYEADLRGGEATTEELRLATQLIAAASGPLDWSRYRDTNTEELRALLDAKIADQPPADCATSAPDMLPVLEALRQSVAAAGGRPRAVAPARPLRPRRRETA